MPYPDVHKLDSEVPCEDEGPYSCERSKSASSLAVVHTIVAMPPRSPTHLAGRPLLVPDKGGDHGDHGQAHTLVLQEGIAHFRPRHLAVRICVETAKKRVDGGVRVPLTCEQMATQLVLLEHAVGVGVDRVKQLVRLRMHALDERRLASLAPAVLDEPRPPGLREG